MCLALLPSLAAGAGDGAQLAFADGQRLYRQAQFRAASVAFERAVQIQPHFSEYHHWLGKAYGRLAEDSHALAALGLARKTRRAFERAVELDRANAAAVESLAIYYERAPALLGGSRRKAEHLREQLGALDSPDSLR